MLTGSRIDGLALASVSRLLYYTDTDRNEIGMMSLNGKYKKVLLRKNITSPRAIVLDEENGFVFRVVLATFNAASSLQTVDMFAIIRRL